MDWFTIPAVCKQAFIMEDRSAPRARAPIRRPPCPPFPLPLPIAYSPRAGQAQCQIAPIHTAHCHFVLFCSTTIGSTTMLTILPPSPGTQPTKGGATWLESPAVTIVVHFPSACASPPRPSPSQSPPSVAPLFLPSFSPDLLHFTSHLLTSSL